jgi:hypothetical protein
MPNGDQDRGKSSWFRRSLLGSSDYSGRDLFGVTKAAHALIAPIMMPFTKYFCRNGKKHMMGSMVTMIVAV